MAAKTCSTKAAAEASAEGASLSRRQHLVVQGHSSTVPYSGEGDGILTVPILGLSLANPILVASGPLSDSLIQIRRALEIGAGGVVTKTIYMGAPERGIERVRKCPAGLFNSTTYSRQTLAQWMRTLTALAQERAPVIASIYSREPEQLAELARRVVAAGAPALELGICCPNDGSMQVADACLVGHYARCVRQAVSVPFSVKLTAADGLAQKAKAALGEGADAISLSDALPALFIDTSARRLGLGGPIGYSGPAIRPIVLHALYQLRCAGICSPVLGIGGVGTAADVLEYLEIGASCVQLYTMLVTNGMSLLRTLVADLLDWCMNEGLTVAEVVGAALPMSPA